MRKVVCSVMLGMCLSLAGSIHAEPWVERGLIPSGVQVDVGWGFLRTPGAQSLGPGVNLEGALGLSENLQIGLRTGYRFSTGRMLQAERYARLFDSETYGTNQDTMANPELRIRYRLFASEHLEFGPELRLYLPVENGSSFGGMLGIPVNLKVLEATRIETGVYFPTVFQSPAQSTLSVPVRVWFQMSESFWLGPIASFRIQNPFEEATRKTILQLGIGGGYSLNEWLDLKGQILFPDLTQTAGARTFGMGLGLGLHID